MQVQYITRLLNFFVNLVKMWFNYIVCAAHIIMWSRPNYDYDDYVPFLFLFNEWFPSIFFCMVCPALQLAHFIRGNKTKTRQPLFFVSLFRLKIIFPERTLVVKRKRSCSQRTTKNKSKYILLWKENNL